MRLAPKRTYSVLVAAMTAAILAGGLAPGYWLLLATQVAFSLALALSQVPATMLRVQWVPPREMARVWGIGNALHKGGMVSPGLWLRRESLAVLARNQLGVIHTDLAACNAYKDALARAAAVKCPTVLVLGDGDLMTPLSKGKALGQAIAGARTVVLKDSGHFMMVERPDETLDALKSHV